MILQKVLGFDPKTMRKRTEVVAGATTFLTMCYILAVNPTILSTTGMDRGALFTSTAIAAAIATLLLVGVLMLDSVKRLNLADVSEAFPAFITMITMVLCYSIADGICLGILSFVILKLCTGKWKQVNMTLVILSLIFIANFILG